MEFKETKIGLVPKDWEVKEVKEIFDFLKTYSFSRKNLDNSGEISYIHYGEIHKNYKFHLDCTKHNLPKISKNLFKNDDIEYLKEGDLIIVDASEDYEGIGESIEIQNLKNNKVVAGLHTFALRDKNNNFADGYKGYIFYNKEVKKTLKKIATGISVLGISKKELSKVLIPIPPLKEQQKIAKILLTCDEMIEKQEKLIKEKGKLKKGLMQKLLNVELRVEGGELKKLPKVRFKEFSGEQKNEKWKMESGEWVEKRLGELIEEYTQKNDKEYQPVAIGIYGIRKREDIFSKNLTNNIKVNKVIFKNTLTFGLGTKQIVFGILLDNQYYSVSPAYKTFKILSRRIIPSFLNYLLFLENKKLSSKYMIISSRQGKSVNIKELLQHKFIIPPTLEEQEKIADVLSTLDKEIDLLKLELEEFKKLKKSLMQKLLTGKVRVRV